MHFPAEVPYTAALAAVKAFRAKDTVTAIDEGLWALGSLNMLRASGSGWNQGPQAVLVDTITDDELCASIESEFAPSPDGTQAAGVGTGFMLKLLQMLIIRLIEGMDRT